MEQHRQPDANRVALDSSHNRFVEGWKRFCKSAPGRARIEAIAAPEEFGDIVACAEMWSFGVYQRNFDTVVRPRLIEGFGHRKVHLRGKGIAFNHPIQCEPKDAIFSYGQ